MITGISRYKKGEFNQTALDEVYNKGKELYKDPTPPPSSGVMPNSLELIWDDMHGGNLNFTTATGKYTSDPYNQYNPTNPPYEIGTPSYRVPTANMWVETELEGTDTWCARTINNAINTRIEMSAYKGYWKDSNNIWHPMNASSRGGCRVPAPTGLVTGNRGCEDQYFVDQREAGKYVGQIVDPYIDCDTSLIGTQIISTKPENYYRWHGWGAKTIFETDTTCKAVFFQIYMRLIVEDETLADDRHLARYVAHTGSDRKELDGTQMWDMTISRFKRVTNDWQSFNYLTGIMTFEELEAHPPPFSTTA